MKMKSQDYHLQCLCHLLPPYVFSVSYRLVFSFYILHIFYPTIFILSRFSTVTLLHLLPLFLFFFLSRLTSESDSLRLFLENKLGNYTFCCEHVLLCKIASCFIQLLMFALCIHYVNLHRHFLVLRIFINNRFTWFFLRRFLLTHC